MVQVLGLLHPCRVKLPLPFCILAAPLLIWLLVTHLGKAVEDGPGVGAPSSMWETQMQLVAPSFGLAHAWLLHLFEE